MIRTFNHSMGQSPCAVLLPALLGLWSCNRPPAPSSGDVPAVPAAKKEAPSPSLDAGGEVSAAEAEAEAEAEGAPPGLSEDDLDVTARFPSGKVWTAKLKKELDIQDVVCAAGTDVEFYESGRLKSAKLAHEQSFQGLPGLAWAGPTVGSGVGFYESGKLLYIGLAGDVTIDGAVWAGGTSVSFHENGRLRTGVLKDAHVFDGIPCAPSATTRFHENGTLSDATLASKHVLVGETFEAGTEVYLAEDGTLDGVMLPKSKVVKSVPCEKLLWVKFYPGGALKQATLSKKFKLAGDTYRKGSTLLFDESGNVEQNIPPKEPNGPKY